MCQTPGGYLWLATLDGLARFDAVRFVVFSRSNTPGIQGNRYTSLYCTGGGEFWAGTESSGITRYRQGKFTTYTTVQGLPSDSVPGVIGDAAGHIWALSNGSILEWNEAGARFVTLGSEQSKYSYIPNGRFGFWSVGKDRVRLFVQGQFLQYPLPLNWPRGTMTRAGQDLNGVTWLSTGDGRFAKLSGGRWSRVVRAGTKRAASPRRDDMESTYRDSRGNLWKIGIASDAAGFQLGYVSLSSRGQTRKIVFNSLYEDHEGSVWLPTDGQGLYRVRKQAVSVLFEGGRPTRSKHLSDLSGSGRSNLDRDVERSRNV